MIGVYNEVRIGYTLTDKGPLWSVDVHLGLPDHPVIVGNGKTLGEAAKRAQKQADAVLRTTGYPAPDGAITQP